jgi:CRP-like cAMP-binding protein
MDKVPFFRNIDPQTRKTNIMLMVILLVLHFIGCIWYAIGEAQLPSLSWLNLKGGHLLTKGISAKYLDSFSWALATTSTVGYGDYSATNATEVVCVILVIVCGALINAAVIGSYSVYSSYLTQEDHRYEVKTQYLRRYFTSRNIPTRIRHRILLYHQFVHNNDTVLSDFEVLNILPMEFRKEVNYALYSHLMDSMAVLVDGDEGFLAMLCSILRPQVHLAGEHVLKAGDFNTELFFLHKGRVEVLPDWFKGKPYTGDRIVLEDGAHFGEITFFLAHVSSATILCLSNVELLVVTREDFRILLHSYPYIRSNTYRHTHTHTHTDTDIYTYTYT